MPLPLLAWGIGMGGAAAYKTLFSVEKEPEPADASASGDESADGGVDGGAPTTSDSSESSEEVLPVERGHHARRRSSVTMRHKVPRGLPQARDRPPPRTTARGSRGTGRRAARARTDAAAAASEEEPRAGRRN